MYKIRIFEICIFKFRVSGFFLNHTKFILLPQFFQLRSSIHLLYIIHTSFPKTHISKNVSWLFLFLDVRLYIPLRMYNQISVLTAFEILLSVTGIQVTRYILTSFLMIVFILLVWYYTFAKYVHFQRHVHKILTPFR